MDGIIGDMVDFMVGQTPFGDGTIGDMVVIMDMAGTILGDGTGGIIGDMAVSDTDMQVLDSDGTTLTMDMDMVTDIETTTVIMATPIEVMPITTQEEVITIEHQ
tara:strand:+ start:356 stop:667 length:312 start_codon:yes stop_codon:yes gene_type:complete